MSDIPSSSQRMAAFDDSDSVNDAIDLLFIEHYISGSHPFARSAFLGRVRKDATLLPPGTQPIRVAVEDGTRSVMASGPGWILCAVRWQRVDAGVSVVAQTEELVEEVFALATDGVRVAPTVDPSKVDVGFWHLGPRGPSRSERSLSVSAWETIRTNYNGRAVSALDSLMAMSRDALPGKLLLLHGPPGTGKTTALRALAEAWRPWCGVDYVLDPDRLFDVSSYLLDIALGDDDERHGTGRSRLLVLEDCDELIASSAKQASGQGLARLLNLTDGLLGQGLSLLVAVTTNEPLARLHPAIVRPGRCIAQIEVGNLVDAEARAWLGRDIPAWAHGYSLADLLALRDGTGPVRADADAVRVGQYL